MTQRANGRRLMIIGGSVIAAVLLLGLFITSRGGSSSSKSAAQAVPQVWVVVAAQSIPQGTTFSAGQPLNTFFEARQEPATMVPFGAYSSVDQIAQYLRSSGCQPNQVVGCRGQATTTQTIYQNLPVVAGMFSSLGQFRTAAGPAFQIPYGYVGIAVSFSDVNSVVNSIKPGDDVDLMASYTGSDPTAANAKNDAPKQTQFVLNDLRVIGVGGPPPPPPAPAANSSTGGTTAPAAASATQQQAQQAGGSLLLLVRYQQALMIQHLKDFSQSWTTSVVLRSAKEQDILHFRTTPVTGRWFFAKTDNRFDSKARY